MELPDRQIFFRDASLNEGVIDRVVRPGKSWRVKVQGVYWSAQAENTVYLVPGDWVRIIGRRNITLLVEPA